MKKVTIKALILFSIPAIALAIKPAIHVGNRGLYCQSGCVANSRIDHQIDQLEEKADPCKNGGTVWVLIPPCVPLSGSDRVILTKYQRNN